MSHKLNCKDTIFFTLTQKIRNFYKKKTYVHKQKRELNQGKHSVNLVYKLNNGYYAVFYTRNNLSISTK